MRGVGGGGAADAEPVVVDSVAGHVLLGLEHDDVDLGCEHAAQHHEATQTDRYTHGGRLDLRTQQNIRLQSCREIEREKKNPMIAPSFPLFPQYREDKTVCESEMVGEMDSRKPIRVEMPLLVRS